MNLVEVLGRDTGCDLMHDGDARQLVAAGLQQMHDVAAGDKEAVRIAERYEPVGEKVGVFRHRV